MRGFWVGMALLATSLGCAAEVKVTEAWARGTVSTQTVTGAFMNLTSTQDAILVGASSPLAGKVEIHEMRMQGGVMKMNAVPQLSLPKGQTVQLKPGHFHLMLFALTAPLKVGDKVPLVLTVESAGKRETIKLDAPVRPLNGGESGAAHAHHGD